MNARSARLTATAIDDIGARVRMDAWPLSRVLHVPLTAMIVFITIAIAMLDFGTSANVVGSRQSK